RIELDRTRAVRAGEPGLALPGIAEAAVVVRDRHLGLRAHGLGEVLDRLVELALLRAAEPPLEPDLGVLRIEGGGRPERAARPDLVALLREQPAAVVVQRGVFVARTDRAFIGGEGTLGVAQAVPGEGLAGQAEPLLPGIE